MSKKSKTIQSLLDAKTNWRVNKVDRLTASLMHLHTVEVTPKSREIFVDKQASFFNLRGYMRATHVSLGNYFEAITRALYGGSLENRIELNGSSTGEDFIRYAIDDLRHTKPDIVNRPGKIIMESKSCGPHSACNLFDEQVGRYIELQLDEPNFDIYYAIYRHGLDKSMSFKGNESELFEEMADRVKFSILLPLSVIFKLFRCRERKKVRRYGREGRGQNYRNISVVSTTVINSFFENPKRNLIELDLNDQEYDCRRFISPKNFMADGYQIKQFPIVWVRDKNREKFIDGVYDKEAGKFAADVPRSEEYNPKEDGCFEFD